MSDVTRPVDRLAADRAPARTRLVKTLQDVPRRIVGRMADRVLPGEDDILPMRWGGDAITADEALGVSRRHARLLAKHGRPHKNAIVDELPPTDAPLVAISLRLPPRLMAFARAKAEMEGRTITQILEWALKEYITNSPGSTVQYDPPPRR